MYRYLRLFLGLFGNIVFILSNFIPKKKELWLFSAWNGMRFLDNPKYIYMEVLRKEKNIEAIWITRSKLLAENLNKKGYPVEYASSWRGLWLQLRAGVVVFTHSVEWDFFAPFVSRNTKRVQTWHGMPIKKIGFDDARGTSISRKRLTDLLYPYRFERLDLVIAGSDADKKCYHTAFNVKEEVVRVTGYPRNDAILKQQERLKEKNPVRKIIYMPTLRGAAGSDFKLFSESNFDFNSIDAVLVGLDVELWIRLHPAQSIKPSDLEEISKCRKIKYIEEESDIYETLGEYMALITDFSGVYFDYLITNNPIIMAPIMMDDYIKNERDLYYSYEEICPSPPVSSWNEVVIEIEKVVENKSFKAVDYELMKTRFHAHIDQHSSQRVVAAIKELV